MKELSIEEKAKRYDEAIKKAKSLYKASEPMSGCNVLLETVFTELKESEDEKIRKELICFLNAEIPQCEARDKYIAWLEKQGETSLVLSNSSNIGKDAWSEEEQNRFAKGVLTSCAMSFIDYLDAHKYEGKMCVSNGECEDIENAFHNAMWDRLHRYYCKYIEKQGEQKPADKVEPKFHEGDWVVSDDKDVHDDYRVCKITKIDDGRYYIEGGDFLSESSLALYEYRPWTIQDAKDGDVLHSPSHRLIWIYKDNEHYYACVNMNYVTENVATDGLICIPNDACPANKVQRSILFQKMKEAGYEWNPEKKELKKIEQKPVFEMKTPDESLGIDSDTYNKIVDDCIYGERKPAVWSKEDEDIINSLVSFLENELGLSQIDEDRKLFKRQIEIVKSLKDRYTWRPSDKQMKALSIASCGVDDPLFSLYQDLKKLK